MSETTPATTTVSIRDKARFVPARRQLMLALFLLLCGTALGQEEEIRAVGVAFRVSPPYFKAYRVTLEKTDALPLIEQKTRLEFPRAFQVERRPLKLRFSVPTWGGEYPDWNSLSPEERQQLDTSGFSLNVAYADLQGKSVTIPLSGETHRLPLPFSVALQAWSVARPFQAALALLALIGLPIGGVALKRRFRLEARDTSLIRDYQLSHKLGEGGMGEVWAATSVQELRCAIKFIKSEHADDEEFKHRFEREIQVWLPLEHPNLLKLFGYGVAKDGRLYTVAELLEGRTLKQVIASGEFDPPQLAALVVEQIGDALAYLHNSQLVHRDIKPDNIFVCSNGDLKLMDMGLMRAESRTSANQAHLTKTGQVLGTPAYMPPEQLGAETGTITAAADQYALGIILYEILVGQRPFTQSDPVILVYQHTRVAPPVPSEMNPRITPEVNEALLKMLAKKPSERFENFEAVQQALLSLSSTTWKAPSDDTLL